MAVRSRSQRSCKGGREILANPWLEAPKIPIEQHSVQLRTTNRGCARTRRASPTPAQEVRWTLQNPARSSHANIQAFPFFELPVELRDQVYSYLVVDSCIEPVLDASAIQQNHKKRLSAENARNRLNQKRAAAGRQATSSRIFKREPALQLNILCASQRLYAETSRHLYNNNRFRLSLTKLPLTTFEVPYGWDRARIVRLDLNLQIKDALRMDRHIDWSTFFSSFSALRFLRIIPSFHPRYYEWAHEQLLDWNTTHYIHKAFFRELHAAIPGSIQLQWGDGQDIARCKGPQDNLLINQNFLKEMIAHLGCKKAT